MVSEARDAFNDNPFNIQVVCRHIETYKRKFIRRALRLSKQRDNKESGNSSNRSQNSDNYFLGGWGGGGQEHRFSVPDPVSNFLAPITLA